MFCNKKSQTWSTVGKIILILIVAVVILLVVDPLLKGGKRGSDIASCKNWAVLQSAIKEPVTGSKLKELKNPCVTFQDKLEGDEYKSYDIIAKGMYDTWNMYGQGKVDFFSDWGDWFKKNTYCFIGDEIKIDKDRKFDVDVFEEYLSNNYPPNSEITYAEFFTGAKNTKLDFGSGNIDLKKDEKLYIMFTVKKMYELPTWGDFGKSTALGCVVGGAIGGYIGLHGGLVLAIPVAWGGCKLGLIISYGYKIIGTIGQADKLYPGLFLITSKDTSSLERVCDGGLHYKPK